MLSSSRTSLVRGLAALHLRQKHSVAVVLSGNGVYDGTEVHEAAAAVAALTRGGAKPIFVAPDVNQGRNFGNFCFFTLLAFKTLVQCFDYIGVRYPCSRGGE